MTHTEALKLAIKALEHHVAQTRPIHSTSETIDALRAALAQPEKTNQCAETCERAKLCAVCARGLAEPKEKPWRCACGANLYIDENGAPRSKAELVQGPVAKVELMTTGGNAGLSTRIVEIDDHLRERLRPGQLLYVNPPQRKPLTEEEILSVLRLTPPEPSLWPHLKDEAVVGDVQKAVLSIARAIEAGASSQWHGIRSIVKTFDGATLECSETAHEINAAIAKAEGQT